jgi:glycyl-tRNA synthetase beta chain
MSGKKNSEFFLELLLEEMPSAAIPGARADLIRRFSDGFSAEGLACDSIQALATPRRLIVVATGLPARQDDRVEEILGPPADRAMDADGRPTPAAEGFARAQGVALADLVRVRSPRGFVMMARRKTAGRPTAEILAEIAPRIAGGLAFPKTMRWGAGAHAFVRPLHGIVALFAGAVVEFELFGIASGNRTVGHRLWPEGRSRSNPSKTTRRSSARAASSPTEKSAPRSCSRPRAEWRKRPGDRSRPTPTWSRCWPT